MTIRGCQHCGGLGWVSVGFKEPDVSEGSVICDVMLMDYQKCPSCDHGIYVSPLDVGCRSDGDVSRP